MVVTTIVCIFVWNNKNKRYGTTIGSVKGMYRSFQKISEGIEPSANKGGFGSMFIQESIDVYNEFMERNNISEREQQTMFR